MVYILGEVPESVAAMERISEERWRTRRATQMMRELLPVSAISAIALATKARRVSPENLFDCETAVIWKKLRPESEILEPKDLAVRSFWKVTLKVSLPRQPGKKTKELDPDSMAK